MSSPFNRHAAWRNLSAAGGVCIAIAAAGLGGCQNFGDVTASIPTSAQALPADDASLRAYAYRWSKAYDATPGEKVASINYARALRGLDRFQEAAAVMRVAAVKAPRDFEVLGAYGKALADVGDLTQAKDVLSRAYPIERPDWTIMSVQGAVEDRLGNYEAAQRFYAEALKIAPGEPSLLSNLGLSYALTRQLGPAEAALTQAAASPRADARVRQNLALVLALEGKFADAEAVSRRDMSPAEAARNVEAIRNMIAQNDAWRTLQTKAPRRHLVLPGPTPSPAATPSG